MLLDRLVHFLDVMVRIPQVGEVHTHQFDALAVDHDCGGDGPFVESGWKRGRGLLLLDPDSHHQRA